MFGFAFWSVIGDHHALGLRSRGQALSEEGRNNREVDRPLLGRHRQQQRQAVQDQRLADVRGRRSRTAAEGKRPQISYYDDGVGTSSFKPLAALGGAFGWGLKRNVLDIYRYACRNYRDGDDIYAFGFSRGAFTARLVVALIAPKGLVRSDERSRLQRKSVAAYRKFRTDFLPRRLQWPTKLAEKCATP